MIRNGKPTKTEDRSVVAYSLGGSGRVTVPGHKGIFG